MDVEKWKRGENEREMERRVEEEEEGRAVRRKLSKRKRGSLDG